LRAVIVSAETTFGGCPREAFELSLTGDSPGGILFIKSGRTSGLARLPGFANIFVPKLRVGVDKCTHKLHTFTIVQNLQFNSS
jgi:hypothetical protein